MADDSIRPQPAPILLLAFNRPDTTARVFDSIRAARPKRFYFACDGPRPNRPGETETVAAVHRLAESIDRSVTLKTLFRDDNLGCGAAVRGAIDWFFTHEERGIILEDDCLPEPTFFDFCSDLLDRYASDQRVGMISGNNWGFTDPRLPYSYTFSRHYNIWGWATWRRAWNQTTANLPRLVGEERAETLGAISPSRRYARAWLSEAEAVLGRNTNSTWDYQWCLAGYRSRMVSIRPRVNLVRNIGFEGDGTHTFASRPEFLRSEPIEFPLVHPPATAEDRRSDVRYERFRYPFFRTAVVSALRAARLDRLVKRMISS